MAVKKKTPEEDFKEEIDGVIKSVNMWKQHAKEGCSDPNWEDGVNMNLLRNHILYHTNNIVALCFEHGFDLPECLDLPMPPEVSNNYMCKNGSKERMERIKEKGRDMIFERPKYNRNCPSIIQVYGTERERKQNGRAGRN